MIRINSKNLQLLRSCIAIFWLGFFIAISFMEAPLKFRVLSLADGLSVGRLVFRALNYCEWLFLALLALTMVLIKTPRLITLLIVAMCLILMLETFWLLPIMDTRAMQLINGLSPTVSSKHIYYVLLEILKIPILFVMAKQGWKQIITPK